ncbi:site-specific DNA-methyltransferase [Burkholderia pyrrocinia]|uniref:site-specific DNA-methyltransferase n=1 Tax=Burkholderia pyrrocinia TaxID=60550 RepID=UPI001588F640|nr:site-specific DNA-methyltransferase [Burkholderia pyrrocinia]
MRNPPERYLQTLRDHFAQAPSWFDGTVLEKPELDEGQADAVWTTNQNGKNTAFQRWFNFKEAFSPTFVAAAIDSLGFRPDHIIDPFGGSGTSAITAQLLSIDATTIEVNPFLADIIKAKISELSAEQLRRAAADFQARLSSTSSDLARLKHLPRTFIEAAGKERWIFPKSVAKRISQYLGCIDAIEDPNVRRFFKVVLGAILISCSNVYVNGKGRRYRRAWKESQATPEKFDELFGIQFNTSFEDVLRFEGRPRSTVNVISGDVRAKLAEVSRAADLIVFSPPYPNSFDYTDIYNVELWTLGYLESSQDNARLRKNTLRSHVQISRDYGMPSGTSQTLNSTLLELEKNRGSLWDDNIPAMVGAYFRDIEIVLEQCYRLLTERGKAMMVVGDSRYANVYIDVASIIAELARNIGFGTVVTEQVRQMRASAQQGGLLQLAESIVELKR